MDSFEALQTVYDKLKKVKNIKIEFAPENLGEGPTKHMMVYEPSGNRVEFVYRVEKK